MTRKPFVAGNWKMNLDLASARALVEGIASGLGDERAIGRGDLSAVDLSVSDGEGDCGDVDCNGRSELLERTVGGVYR